MWQLILLMAAPVQRMTSPYIVISWAERSAVNDVISLPSSIGQLCATLSRRAESLRYLFFYRVKKIKMLKFAAPYDVHFLVADIRRQLIV
jgi:hypothetical protein